MKLPLPVAVSVATFASSLALADVDPVLTVNGVSSNDNTATVAVVQESTVQVSMSGTAGAPFALLLSAAADGTLASGFYLTPFAPPASGIHSPIHPALDGIGSAYVAAQLGLPANDFVPSNAVPFFTFDATGTFAFSAPLPAIAPLVDDDPAMPPGFPFGPGQPIPYPFQEPFSIYLQVVSVDTQTLGVRVGNGLRIDFLGKEFAATVAVSDGTDADPNQSQLGEMQTLGKIVDADLSGGPLGVRTTAPDFAGSFDGATDIWMIQLAGAREAVATAGDAFVSEDSQTFALQGYASSLEVHTGEAVARDNENPEYPRIRLPGGRQLFHWRDGGAATPTYGFGVLFEETGTFRNLVPAAFGTFSESATRSPWEVSVAVSPDGDRALAVLDASSDLFGGLPFDRLFLLNLEDGGTFSNGFPVLEVTPPIGESRQIFERSITFSRDGAGGWTAWVMSTTSGTVNPLVTPNRLWRIEANAGATPAIKIAPTGSTVLVQTLEPTMRVDGDHDVVCFVGGPSTTSEDVYSITNVTPLSLSIQNITAFPSPTRLRFDSGTSDGRTSFAHLSDDGSRYAGVREPGSTSTIPFTVTTDGSQAGAVADIVRDISLGGDFDLDDFRYGQGLLLTDDGGHLLFHQGLFKAGAASDACDLFVHDVAGGATTNLTRTIRGVTPLTALNGPWDVTSFQDQPTVGFGGAFFAPDRRHLILFRDAHLTGDDRFNLYAVDVEPGGAGAAPSFELTNVTGTEFEPSFGTPAPTTGVPDLITQSGFFIEQRPGFYRPRRVGGAGPLGDHYFFTARFADDVNQIEHLFLFDAANPTAALQVTDFSAATPFSVGPNASIRSVTPHQEDFSVAFVLNDGAGPGQVGDELVVQPLFPGAAATRVPATGGSPQFDRAITAGSIRWLPGAKSALVWMEGTTARPAGNGPDGLFTQADAQNPIDATPWFLTLADPANARKIASDPPAGHSRAGMIWSVR